MLTCTEKKNVKQNVEDIYFARHERNFSQFKRKLKKFATKVSQ